MIKFIKNLFNKLFKKKPAKLIDPIHKVQATPERIALKKKLDQTLSCHACGKRSGYFKITLRKISKGKYICGECMAVERMAVELDNV